MNLFPESWSSETVAYWLMGFAVAAMLALSGLVRAVQTSTKPLPVVIGGQAGDVLKITPQLPSTSLR